jgi:shikimate dehydrogenase
VEALREGRLAGANITTPHKLAIRARVDTESPDARAVGAVNTVVRRPDGTLEGHNTDVTGFGRTLAGLRLEAGAAVVLGAGGAARAVAHVLLESAWEVTLLGRTPDTTREVARDMVALHPERIVQIGPLTADSLTTLGGRIDLLVNATPVGSGAPPGSPWPDGTPLPRDAVVVDLVAWPPVTPLLAAARARGLVGVNGIPMLVVQAAEAFELWTGSPAPVDVMRDAAMAEAARTAGESRP